MLGLCGIAKNLYLVHFKNNTLVLLNIGIALEWILYNKINVEQEWYLVSGKAKKNICTQLPIL